MVRLRRKLLADTVLLGVALTLVVLLLDHFGVLDALENYAYDKRALTCQFFAPPPTDKLVHLDIDDRSLQVIGQWPWPRADVGRMIDELARAQVKVIALDVIYAEPSKATEMPSDPLNPDSKKVRVDHDAEFAAALRRAGNAIVPLQLLGGVEHQSPIEQAMFRELRTDLELSAADLKVRLAAAGYQQAQIVDAMDRFFFPVRRDAAFSRVREVLETKDQPLGAVIASLLRVSADGPQRKSPMTRLIEEQYEQARAARAVRRLATTMPAGAPATLRVSEIYTLPLAIFGEAAAATGFVDYRFSGDPVVRAAPLFIAHGDRLFPQMGLAMACEMLGTDPASIRVQPDVVVLPRKDGPDVRIPVRTVVSRVSRVPMVAYIPWFGRGEWQTMYDWPRHVEVRQHVPFIKVWDVVQTRDRIVWNNRNCDKAIDVILGDDPPPEPGAKEQVKTHLSLDPAKAQRYAKAPPPLDDVESRQAIAKFCKDESATWIESFEEIEKKGDLKPDERAQLDQLRAARTALDLTLGQSRQLVGQLETLRKDLRTAVGGKAVLVGYTASASVADQISTSIHDKSPGVVVHGAIFNAIMTNHFWRAAPAWVTPMLTLLLGLLTAAASAWLPPVRALITAVAMLAAYLVLNGVMMFDRFGVIVGVAGPAVAIMVVWAGCVLMRTIIEAKERAMITRRFQAYVDPTLVEYVLENPQKARLDGEVKELTVVFTDLANFTTLSEKLGEKSVSLLNDYMAEMVPIIRQYRGYVNKFLGDGIMCFYGAPRDSVSHAPDAVYTALDMQRAMVRFNQTLAEQGYSALGVRVGISTGRMVVGDAGSADAADYTVLGDAVNFGSRLEGANKYLGTRILVSERTAELAKKEFLFRYVGRVRVVGKTEGVGVYEPLCVMTEATDAHRKTVELTKVMVDAYQAGRFDGTIGAADALDEHVGAASKLAAAYRERARKCLDEGKPDDFDGALSLTEK